MRRHKSHVNRFVLIRGIILMLVAVPYWDAARVFAVAPGSLAFTLRLGSQYFNTPGVTGKFLVLAGQPAQEAVVIRSQTDGGICQSDLAAATWIPYDGIIRLNLGATDGVYNVMLGLKGAGSSASPVWTGTAVTLLKKSAGLTLKEPAAQVVTQPYLQVYGWSPNPLATVEYGISNADRVVTAQPALLLADSNRYPFHCVDLLLDNGLNIINLRSTDLAGNVFTTNLTVTLDYSRAVRPIVRLVWPQNGHELCGDSFTLSGWVDDDSSSVTAAITDTNGNTREIPGSVERDGNLWVEDIPLSGGLCQVALTVKNSAGLTTVTNLSVSRSTFAIAMDPVAGSLWLPTTTVTGTESDATYAVWVNGVKAAVRVNANGTGQWIAYNVPVSPGGIASFDMSAFAPDEKQPDGTYANGSAVAALMSRPGPAPPHPPSPASCNPSPSSLSP